MLTVTQLETKRGFKPSRLDSRAQPVAASVLPLPQQARVSVLFHSLHLASASVVSYTENLRISEQGQRSGTQGGLIFELDSGSQAPSQSSCQGLLVSVLWLHFLEPLSGMFSGSVGHRHLVGHTLYVPSPRAQKACMETLCSRHPCACALASHQKQECL